MRRTLVAAAIALAAGCSSSGPPGDLAPPDLFAWAQEKFDAEDYRDASDGFLAFLIRDPLSPLVDSAQYLAAEAQLRAGRELEAVEEFDRLATGRPGSPWADDAQLGVCRAYMEASPKVSLSQEFTRRAIEECERLIQFFPTSDLTEEARRLVAEARAKLARKSFEIGKYYEDRRDLLESALVYYEKAVSEGPPAAIFPELLARMVRSYREIGFDTEAETTLGRLLSEFPESEEARELAEDGGSDG
ncbi:MAG: outer membrane protein assembly factor BamD [Gemmatimonadota bacterium]|nr:outer membrane protein assembly factor BamD [Gemmatimonadota bacterium]